MGAQAARAHSPRASCALVKGRRMAAHWPAQPSSRRLISATADGPGTTHNIPWCTDSCACACSAVVVVVVAHAHGLPGRWESNSVLSCSLVSSSDACAGPLLPPPPPSSYLHARTQAIAIPAQDSSAPHRRRPLGLANPPWPRIASSSSPPAR